MTQITTTEPLFTQVIVIRNPVSTNARRAQKRILKLQSLMPKTAFEIVDTAASGRVANKAILHKLSPKLGAKTLLCVAAGDGTINMVAEALLNDPTLPAVARLTPLLPLWGGNANDLAHMLNGHGFMTPLTHILHAGKIVEIHPLTCTLDLPDGSQQKYSALCYASFGASAFAARRLSQPALRNHPLDKLPGGREIKEFIATMQALFAAPQVPIEEDGQIKDVYEHIFLKGSRFAKVKGARLRLTDPHFYHTVMRRKRARSFLFHVWELTEPRAARRVAGDHASFVPQQAMWGQVDGEVFNIPAHTKVEITLSRQSLRVFSTLLK
ncbi:MAG TPA: diacylglycerol kinase family protein [Patescibacteria group bacterium]|nr:diacylglycerol kinase family protein [Patescibacteria group bacterium]